MEILAIISAVLESPWFWAAIAALDVFISKSPAKENNVFEVIFATLYKLKGLKR